MTSRRDLLKKLGLGMTAVSVGTVTAHGETLSAFVSGNSIDEAPWWLLAPLKLGSNVGKGWVISALKPVVDGASVLTLKHFDGVVYNVHICGHIGHTKGLAHTTLLDLVLMDGGQGDKRTNEALGRVLFGIAKRIHHNELETQAELDDIARLQTHDERVGRYGPENLV